ncbi:MAG: peptidoglycan-binding protein [Bacteroidetes bacterium]|nr:peptidoglycan-binding protein [Bacteroidota bacterium]
MIFRIKILFLILLFPLLTNAQEGTRNAGKKELSGNVMVVPFEPKLYMSEIDQKINQQTKWSFDQMREFFRHQLDSQLKLKLQGVDSPVLTFYTDSVKTSKDLEFVYKSTTVSFDMVDRPTAPTVENKKQSGIKNGQIAVEQSSDKKFTNVKLNNKELIPFLNKKYNTHYFVFVNELDIKTVEGSYDLSSDSFQREVTVHYTIIDENSKLISAGAATARFSSKINDPKKIVSLTFSPIAAYIAAKLDAVVHPKPAASQK